MTRRSAALTLAVLPLLTACGIGYNRTLFATKTNVGFEVSSEPPALQRQKEVPAPQVAAVREEILIAQNGAPPQSAVDTDSQNDTGRTLPQTGGYSDLELMTGLAMSCERSHCAKKLSQAHYDTPSRKPRSYSLPTLACSRALPGATSLW